MPEDRKTNGEVNLEGQIADHLRAVKSAPERRTIAGLLRALSNLPLDHEVTRQVREPASVQQENISRLCCIENSNSS